MNGGLPLKSGAEVTAVQTLRESESILNGAERLDCGGSPPLSFAGTRRQNESLGARRTTPLPFRMQIFP
jgi:exopolysaccharide biosynthesis protein